MDLEFAEQLEHPVDRRPHPYKVVAVVRGDASAGRSPRKFEVERYDQDAWLRIHLETGATITNPAAKPVHDNLSRGVPEQFLKQQRCCPLPRAAPRGLIGSATRLFLWGHSVWFYCMSNAPCFTVELAGGQKLTGSLSKGAVHCRGEPVDPSKILALDERTLFLAGATQYQLLGERCGELSGFLELEVVECGPVTVDLGHVHKLMRHPE
jgi:hypothetical protein